MREESYQSFALVPIPQGPPRRLQDRFGETNKSKYIRPQADKVDRQTEKYIRNLADIDKETVN